MYKKILFVFAHLLFWSLSIYVITRIFGVSIMETVEKTDNGVDIEKLFITYDHEFTWATIITACMCAVVFYSNIFLFLKEYFKEKNFGSYAFKISALILVAIGVSVLLNRYLNYGVIDRRDVFLFPSFGLHMGLFIFYTSISFAYAFTFEWLKNEKLRSEITKEKLKTELNFLKSQINPHFLFNTLNNLFSISQKFKADELSTGINELSNLMRYMLYESNTDFVSLKKEVKYIESFIEIQKLRYDETDEVIINFEKSGPIQNLPIAPMILLPFVENAFKHGISINESSVIQLFLNVTKDTLSFKVKNKIHNEQPTIGNSSGVGLKNVKRRLDLIYPNKYQLKMSEKNDIYTIDLEIQTK
ncbi:histidine kinase [Flavobacteriaceae bacterium F89]|uniref:Histidine kinase n=1 Tax=Cerina litoralis TaxID=2874477 RepID=A0AAE3EUB6_9FLAO|nr:histidine kinase [Cerina litoralis]MCG2459772.1 histidine kinase [Cerina litoralis]